MMKSHTEPPTMFHRYAKFNRGHRSLKNEFCEGRPKLVVLLENIDAVRNIIRLDHHETYEIEASLGMNSTNDHSILHEH